VVAPRCTSPQQNAHVTESRVVLYRWHPWCGRSAYIFGAFTKGEQAVFRCALERGDVARSLEVPQWMFDAAACCRVALVEAASVSVETLREFDRLLRAAMGANESGVLQAEHLRYPMREVLVRHRRDPGSLDQLTMFHPLPTTPRWGSLPVEVREQTLKLLARLLQIHRRSRLGGRRAAREVCDE
jgi:hypothetical protein